MEFVLIRCWSCSETFYTANDMQTHHLDAHERALVPREPCAALDDADFPPRDLGPTWNGNLAEEPDNANQ